jgi:glyoxylase-like metal-dependent hydrolase (beta-lactamase superfamily II)
MDHYRFDLGNFHCACLLDGTYDYEPESFFANAPEEEVRHALKDRGFPVDHVTTPYTYLYADTGKNRILVDMGAGKLAPTTGKLLASMESAGIDPSEIDTVFITHAHPDHIGGMLDDQGKPNFPFARYFIWKEEWDFWFSEAAYSTAPEKFVQIARKLLTPVREKTERVKLAAEGVSVLPGAAVMAAPGHTPGHMVVELKSNGEELVYIGDTVLSPMHLEFTDWKPVYDLVPDKAASSMQKVFDRAARKGEWVVGQHFPPFPSLGHIEKKGKGWRWSLKRFDGLPL